MPISQINPDGSVKIYNKNTGQVLDVKPEELPKYNAGLVQDYQKLQQEQQGIKDAAAAVQQGKIKVSDVPAEQKLKVISEITKAGGVLPETPSADAIKKKKAADSALKLVGTMEQQYQGAGGAEVDMPVISRINGMVKDAQGALGFNDQANRYNATKEGFAAALKQITGDTGVLTDQDYERLSKLLPGLGAKPGEAKAAFNIIRQQLAGEGQTPSQTTINPKTKDIIDLVAPATKSYMQNTMSMAQEKNPQKIMQNAQDAAQSANPAQAISMALQGNKMAQQKLAATGEINGIVTAPGNVMSLAKGAMSLPGKVVASGANEARKVAAQEAGSVDTKALIKAGEDYVKNVDPSAAKAWETLKPSIKANTDLPELLTKVTNWGDKAYTNSGDKRAITEGLLKSHLYGAARNIIKEQAPEVADLTAKMAGGIGRKKLLGKIGTGMAMGVPTALAIAYATQALGQRK